MRTFGPVQVQVHLPAAYERRGVVRFSETSAGELEAEAELECRKWGLAVLSQARTRSKPDRYSRH